MRLERSHRLQREEFQGQRFEGQRSGTRETEVLLTVVCGLYRRPLHALEHGQLLALGHGRAAVHGGGEVEAVEVEEGAGLAEVEDEGPGRGRGATCGIRA